MLNLLVEFIGTFLFFSVILKHPLPLPIAIALAAAIYFGNGAYNPGVSLMQFLTEQLSMEQLVQNVAAQLFAAVAAVYFNKLQ